MLPVLGILISRRRTGVLAALLTPRLTSTLSNATLGPSLNATNIVTTIPMNSLVHSTTPFSPLPAAFRNRARSAPVPSLFSCSSPLEWISPVESSVRQPSSARPPLFFTIEPSGYSEYGGGRRPKLGDPALVAADPGRRRCCTRSRTSCRGFTGNIGFPSFPAVRRRVRHGVFGSPFRPANTTTSSSSLVIGSSGSRLLRRRFAFAALVRRYAVPPRDDVCIDDDSAPLSIAAQCRRRRDEPLPARPEMLVVLVAEENVRRKAVLDLADLDQLLHRPLPHAPQRRPRGEHAAADGTDHRGRHPQRREEHPMPPMRDDDADAGDDEEVAARMDREPGLVCSDFGTSSESLVSVSVGEVEWPCGVRPSSCGCCSASLTSSACCAWEIFEMVSSLIVVTIPSSCNFSSSANSELCLPAIFSSEGLPRELLTLRECPRVVRNSPDDRRECVGESISCCGPAMPDGNLRILRLSGMSAVLAFDVVGLSVCHAASVGLSPAIVGVFTPMLRLKFDSENVSSDLGFGVTSIISAPRVPCWAVLYISSSRSCATASSSAISPSAFVSACASCALSIARAFFSVTASVSAVFCFRSMSRSSSRFAMGFDLIAEHLDLAGVAATFARVDPFRLPDPLVEESLPFRHLVLQTAHLGVQPLHDRSVRLLGRRVRVGAQLDAQVADLLLQMVDVSRLLDGGGLAVAERGVDGREAAKVAGGPACRDGHVVVGRFGQSGGDGARAAERLEVLRPERVRRTAEALELYILRLDGAGHRGSAYVRVPQSQSPFLQGQREGSRGRGEATLDGVRLRRVEEGGERVLRVPGRRRHGFVDGHVRRPVERVGLGVGGGGGGGSVKVDGEEVVGGSAVRAGGLQLISGGVAVDIPVTVVIFVVVVVAGEQAAVGGEGNVTDSSSWMREIRPISCCWPIDRGPSRATAAARLPLPRLAEDVDGDEVLMLAAEGVVRGAALSTAEASSTAAGGGNGFAIDAMLRGSRDNLHQGGNRSWSGSGIRGSLSMNGEEIEIEIFSA
ncbi:LOW QUALITY PROTEIN: hypothetical protein Dda_2567 [Drechslerella dactyloides]|uniref:Uncharacterized protein n=1 Tax=Drechslerella dactyloides TaxID=74499 RepID=A0AAD6IZS2_DREDA|nr:LOW QUALITY PROTEIN: hypothetical protein Dda_2567 [Drechslerella dactyloides]